MPEHLMLSFSQITPPSYFGRGQRARDVDGYDRPVTGLRRMTPADPGTYRQARRA
jgi:hypothetical protein